MEMIILAFFAGCLGALIGGTQCFVIYGFLGLVATVVEACGVDMSFLDAYLLQLFFLPAIFFSAAVPATAFAAMRSNARLEKRKKRFNKVHEQIAITGSNAPITRVTEQILGYVLRSSNDSIKGCEVARSLAFTRDPFVIIVGGIGGIVGYLFFSIAGILGLPLDAGAFSVVVSAVFYRLIFVWLDKENDRASGRVPTKVNGYNGFMSPNAMESLEMLTPDEWCYEVLFAIIVSVPTAYFVDVSGFVSIAFYISAALLLFQFVEPSFPVSHHVTMVSGYAIIYTGNLVLAVIFGVIAQLIFIVFSLLFNSNAKTHIDPPAVAILICSLVIFLGWS